MDDRSLETIVSVILRSGVIVSGLIVLGGGIAYLAAHGKDAVDLHHFVGQPLAERSVTQIVHGALQGRAQSMIQAGVLCLIATPILRVAFSIIGFALERDRTYVVITIVVLCVLAAGLLSGSGGGG